MPLLLGIALRGLFIINPEGVLEQITMNNLPVGRSVDETLRLITAFQFVAEHGEVCPADWWGLVSSQCLLTRTHSVPVGSRARQGTPRSSPASVSLVYKLLVSFMSV